MGKGAEQKEHRYFCRTKAGWLTLCLLLMLRRAPSAAWLTEEWQEKMKKIENCIHCGHCVRHCPYGLNTPELLRRNYEDYKTFLK